MKTTSLAELSFAAHALLMASENPRLGPRISRELKAKKNRVKIKTARKATRKSHP